MSTRYYVDKNGKYLGGWATTEIDGQVFESSPPDGAEEVPSPPEHASQPWLGDKWGDIPEVSE